MGVTYVSEYEGDQISIFNNERQFVMSFGEFSSPIGLAVHASGVLYVCDRKNLLMF